MITPGNILLIRLKSIGDILFTLPAAHRVRTAFPEARLTFLVSAEHAALLEGFPGSPEVMVLDRARFRGGVARAAREAWRLGSGLRRGKFDLVIDFQGYGETAWLTRLSGAPRRWGVVYRRGRAWAYTDPVAREDQMHPAEFYLRFLARCGAPATPVSNQFTLPARCLSEAREWLQGAGMDGRRPMLFLQPLTSSPHKNWGVENYLRLAEVWRRRGFQILVGGGPADRVALRPAAEAGCAVAAGAPLLVSAALMHLSALVVGGDTGLMHLAVATGRRVVMVMNSNSGGSTHPFLHPEWAATPAPGESLQGLAVARVQRVCEECAAGGPEK